MRKLIYFEKEANYYNQLINLNRAKGLKSVVYASKHMSISQAEHYFSEYLAVKRSAVDQEGKYLALAKQLECNLEFEAVVGFKNKLRPDASKTVSMLKSMGVNVHILSGDELDHFQSIAFSLDLLDKNSEEIVINFEDSQTGRIQLQKCLDKIRSNIMGMGDALDPITPAFSPENMKKLVGSSKSTQIGGRSLHKAKNLKVCIAGCAIAAALRDPYLQAHLKLTLEFSQTVIGYSMSSHQKAQVVDLFKQLEHKTLAVGDGFNDINMLQTADVGVQLLDRSLGLQFGDMVTDSLIAIPTKMNHQVRSWNENLHLAVNFIFGYSLTITLADAFFKICLGLRGRSVLPSTLIFVSNTLNAVCMMAFILTIDQHQLDRRLALPALYCEKNYATKPIYAMILIFRLVPAAIFEALLCFIIPALLMVNSSDSSGRFPKFDQIQVILWLLSLLSVACK